MTRQKLSALLFSATFGFAALAPACGLQPPIQDAAAVAKDGIQLAVLRQSCSQTVETEQPGNDLVEAIVEVEVRNSTPAPIGVRRDGFRLGASNGSAIRPSTWSANHLVSIEPGQAQTFQLRFMSRGGLSCSREMALEFPAAIIKGTQPVKIEDVKVVPVHALSGSGASAS